MSGGVNIASGRNVTLSSENAQFPGSNAVDGDFDNFVHTSCNEEPWLQVDLGAFFNITQIKVFNRKDCCSGRIVGAKLEICGSDPSVPIWTSDTFKGLNGETGYTDEGNGWYTYSVTLPSTVVTTGSLPVTTTVKLTCPALTPFLTTNGGDTATAPCEDGQGSQTAMCNFNGTWAATNRSACKSYDQKKFLFRHMSDQKCFDGDNNSKNKFYASSCAQGNNYQTFLLQKAAGGNWASGYNLKQVAREKCLENWNDDHIQWSDCNTSSESQHWIPMANNQIRHVQTKKCLDGNGTDYYLLDCDAITNKYQQWERLDG
jgi:hypothetical protein